MHTIVIRRDFLTQHPGLAQVIFEGFCTPRDAHLHHLRRSHENTVPWFNQLNCWVTGGLHLAGALGLWRFEPSPA